jgi:hypothetical protein
LELSRKISIKSLILNDKDESMSRELKRVQEAGRKFFTKASLLTVLSTFTGACNKQLHNKQPPAKHVLACDVRPKFQGYRAVGLNKKKLGKSRPRNICCIIRENPYTSRADPELVCRVFD